MIYAIRAAEVNAVKIGSTRDVKTLPRSYQGAAVDR